MGIDKWRAIHNRWRISEKSLFFVALIGGSIGMLAGMYLFHHKTKKYRFSIGIPAILALQLLILLFVWAFWQGRALSPSAAVKSELEQIRKLDEETIQTFVSYENMVSENMISSNPASMETGAETTEAIELFFQNFQYHIYSEEIDGDHATVNVEIINIDTHALARDLCRSLTAHSLNLRSDTLEPKSLNDCFVLLRDTLKTNRYALISSTACFHLTKEGRVWVIQTDETLQDELVSGFISWMNDPDILSAEEVLTIYLDEFEALTAQEWIDYLQIDDIFDTGSASLSPEVDRYYMEKITEYFSCTIDSCRTNGSSADADITVRSIDMPGVLENYKQKLLEFAQTAEAITCDDTALADTSARFLLEALEESAEPASSEITVHLYNDGRTWQLEISDDLTDAFLGNIGQALETFSQPVSQ